MGPQRKQQREQGLLSEALNFELATNTKVLTSRGALKVSKPFALISASYLGGGERG